MRLPVLLLLTGCAARGTPAHDAPVPMVTLRAEDLAGLPPHLHADAGLRAAAEELVAGATRPDARLTPEAMRVALARAGYPRDAHVLRAHTARPGVPQELLDAVPHGADLDIGWASRPDGVGGATWILAWAPRIGTIDPIPRDLPLDRGLPLRVDGLTAPRLLIGAPDGSARELSVLDGTARWIDGLHIPGEYRIEVLERDQVAFLFSLFVDAPVPDAAPLPGPVAAAEPMAVADDLAARIAELRARNGLRPLTAFARLLPETRAQAACLASTGEVAHRTDRCPGVPAMAERSYFPHARHHEDVVAADTAAEAWERLMDSPGHRLNLLCAACTHLTVGAATEPTVPARTFAVIELLEFPDGEPVPIVRGRQ